MKKVYLDYDLVINWHITEACNYSCFFCFAKWQDKNRKEILHSDIQINLLMDELQKLKALLGQCSSVPFGNIRLNLVGGEIFLYKNQLVSIIKAAKSKGFQISAITNGSLLDPETISVVADNFTSLGFSIDSLDTGTNLKIGRAFKNIPMNVHLINQSIAAIRAKNPSIEIKINTVVNEFNKLEEFHSFIEQTKPHKWKIFKMLPVIRSENGVSTAEFHQFLERHQNFGSIISSEDNDEMTHSYLMVDPLGRLFQNSAGSESGYSYSRNILEHGIEAALTDIEFDKEKFRSRYKLINTTPVSLP